MQEETTTTDSSTLSKLTLNAPVMSNQYRSRASEVLTRAIRLLATKSVVQPIAFMHSWHIRWRVPLRPAVALRLYFHGKNPIGEFRANSVAGRM